MKKCNPSLPWVLVLALAALTAQAQEAQEGRALSGIVVDSTEGGPIGAAQVVVKGTALRTYSQRNGTFTLRGLPPGRLTLQVSLKDFKSAEVAVGPEQEEVRIQLELDYLGVEEMVVVGRATETSVQNVANSVAVVQAEELTRAPSQSVDQALAGKVAGANIQTNSGAPGGGVQVRLRGISSINGGIDPLYVVDGVIVSNSAINTGMSAVTASNVGSGRPPQDDPVNRIADLNPNDIESITVLKGASAAAIYGSKAANGVVIITTRRGKEGAPQLNLTQRLGAYSLLRTVGSRRFSSEEEAVESLGESARQYYSDQYFDNERALAGRSDLSTETAISVSGSEQGLRYFASGLVKNDEGIIANTGYSKQAFRLNLDRSFGDRLELRMSTNLVHSLARRGLVNNDNRGNSFYVVLASTPSFYDLRQRADGSWPSNPFLPSQANPLQTAALMKNDEDVWRFIGSADAILKLWEDEEQSLKVVANVGADRFQQKNEMLFPPELYFEPVDDGLPGTSLFATSESFNLNVNTNLVHTWKPASGLFNATTSLGFQHEQRALDSMYVVSRNLNGGQQNVDSGTQVGITQSRQRVTDRGFYLQEDLLLLEDRLSLSAALRAEQSSTNANASQLYFFPKAAAAYRLLGLTSWFDELKVRAAYGETGNQPLYSQRFTPLAVNRNIGGNPGSLVAGTTGAPDLRPERQQEVELGFDAILFSSGARVDFTVYNRNITDLLLQRALAPSTGFTSQFFNGGEMLSQGVEIGAQVAPIRTQELEWVARATFSRNVSRITRLPVPAFNAGGFGASLGLFRIEEGRLATQIVGNTGLRPDGTCCVVGQIGNTEPDFRASLSNSVSWKGFTLGFLLDWQQGSQVINLTRFLYDLGAVSPDYVGAGQQRLEQFSTNAAVSLEDASFLKLRELSLTYDLPRETVSAIWGAVRSARVGVSGRNLFILTGYSGLDPEVSNFGNQAIARNIDVAPFPPSRSVWGFIDVGF